MTHARERNPSTESPVNAAIEFLGERDQLGEVLAHPRASDASMDGPGAGDPPTDAGAARSQSPRRAAWDPIDQSTLAASIRKERRRG